MGAGELLIQLPGFALSKATVAETGVQMQMPMYIGETPFNLWLLPLEPQISVRARNVIIRRTIAKQQSDSNRGRSSGRGFGSVKELWAQDDYEVIINGMLRDHNKPDELPTELVSRLTGLCSLKKPIYVHCDLLNALGIGQIAIESYDFPPTPGIGDQAYSIKGLSDQSFNLFIEK